jgi:hypothetical protein
MRTLLKFIRRLRLSTCSFCNEPVEIETGKRMTTGKLIHEECYAATMRLKAITPPPKLRNGTPGRGKNPFFEF